MKHIKARICKCTTIMLFVALCSGIGLPAPSVSAATIASHTPMKNCHSEYKRDVRNAQGKKVGFVYAWTDTCNNSSNSQVQSCSSSAGSASISIKIGQLSITC